MSAVAHIKQYKSGRFFTDEFRGELSWNGYENNVLLRNEGPGADGALRLTRAGLALGADAPRDARGMASFDYDGDGDLDIIINHNPGDTGDPEAARPTLLRNEVGAARNWLAVELEGRKSNRDGIGAVVQLEAGGLRQMRHASAGSAYASQSSGKLYFGLGAESKVDILTVRWPAGTVEKFRDITARQVVRIVEGEGLKSVTRPSS